MGSNPRNQNVPARPNKPNTDQSQTNRITLRCPPGARFIFWGTDLQVEFQFGHELEVIDYLRQWLDAYALPMAKHAVALRDKNNAQVAEQKKIADEHAAAKRALASPNAHAPVPATIERDTVPPDTETKPETEEK